MKKEVPFDRANVPRPATGRAGAEAPAVSEARGRAVRRPDAYLITGPYLAYTGYEDLLPRRDEITTQWLAHAKEIFEQEMCTEFEAMLYLSTASLSASRTHDWFAIYMWLFNRWKPEAAEDMDIGVELLDPNQVGELAPLGEQVIYWWRAGHFSPS